MGDNTFMKKENRDAAYFAMSIEERRKHIRRSGGPYQLHPMYVADYEKETGRVADTGFPNSDYMRMWDRLYFINKKDEH